MNRNASGTFSSSRRDEDEHEQNVIVPVHKVENGVDDISLADDHYQLPESPPKSTSQPFSSREEEPLKCRIPLLAAFLPQLLAIIAICIVTTVTFIDVYTKATDEATKDWLTGSVSLLEQRIVEPLEEVHTDIKNVKDVVLATGASAKNVSGVATFPDLNRFGPFYHMCRSLIRNKEGRYSTCLQYYVHNDTIPADDAHGGKEGAYALGLAGCGESTCVYSHQTPNATFQLELFDVGWYQRYPSEIVPTIGMSIPDLRGNPVVAYDGSRQYDEDRVTWNTQISVDPTSGESYVTFTLVLPLVLDRHGEKVDVKSLIFFSVNALQKLNTLVRTTNVTSSHYAVMDLSADAFIVTNYPNFKGFDAGLQNESVTDRFEYIRQPSLVRISEAPVADLKVAIETLTKNYDGGKNTAVALSSLLTTTPTLDFSSNDDLIISSVAVRSYDLDIGIVITTDKELYKERIRSATSEVLAVTVIFFVFAVLCSVITAIFIVRPIKETSNFVEAMALLDTKQQGEDAPSQSMFSELASLQQASSDMGKLLMRLKCFVPQTVMVDQRDNSSSDAGASRGGGQSTSFGGDTSGSAANPFTSPGVTSAPVAHSKLEGPVSTTNSNSVGLSTTNDEHLLDATSNSQHSSEGHQNKTLTLNVDRLISVKENAFQSTISTMLVVQLNLQHSPKEHLVAFGKECDGFMKVVIPHLLKGKGVIELQRPDMIIAMFDRGVHAERAAQCAVKIAKGCKMQRLMVNVLVHSGPHLVGACGSQGRVAFVQFSPFFYTAMRILDFSRRCLQPNTILVTDAVAKSLPPTIVAVPVENIRGVEGSPTILYQIFRVKSEGYGNTLRSETLRMKQVFADMTQGRFSELLEQDNRTRRLQEENNKHRGIHVEDDGLVVQPSPFSTTAPQLQHHVARMRKVAQLLDEQHHHKGRNSSAASPHFQRRFVGWTIDGHHPMCDDLQNGEFFWQKNGSSPTQEGQQGPSHLHPGNYNSNEISSSFTPNKTSNNNDGCSSSTSSSTNTEKGDTEKLRRVLQAKTEEQHQAAQEIDFFGGAGGSVDEEQTDSEQDRGGGSPAAAQEDAPSAQCTVATAGGSGSLVSGYLTQSESERRRESNAHPRNQELHDDDELCYVPPQFEDIHHRTWLPTPDERLLGEGAFSKVFLGMNSQGDMVALKCIDMEKTASSSMMSLAAQTETLETEVAVLAAAHHPNVAAFISVAVHKSLLILVMEYVSGGTLRNTIASYGFKLPRAAVRRFALDVVKGLHYLHVEKQIVHGDIKPENVLIGADSVCKLTDFGSAVENIYGRRNKNPADGHGEGVDEFDIRGTAPYIAPEVAHGSLPTPASDVWSFGVLLHELITGELPWPKPAVNSQVTLMRGLARRVDDHGALRPQLHPALLSASNNADVDPLLLKSPTRPNNEATDAGGGGPSLSISPPSTESDKQMALRVISACLQERPEERPTTTKLLQEFAFLL